MSRQDYRKNEFPSREQKRRIRGRLILTNQFTVHLYKLRVVVAIKSRLRTHGQRLNHRPNSRLSKNRVGQDWPEVTGLWKTYDISYIANLNRIQFAGLCADTLSRVLNADRSSRPEHRYCATNPDTMAEPQIWFKSQQLPRIPKRKIVRINRGRLFYRDISNTPKEQVNSS